MIEDREYQNEAIDAVLADWAGGVQRPAVVLPTGMGKTTIFVKLMKRIVSAFIRPLVIVHRDELVKQTVGALSVIAPELTVGVIKGDRNEIEGRQIVVASIATLGRASRLSVIPRHRFTATVVDEAHHAAADSYVRVLEHFRTFEAGAASYAVGFTATMEHSDRSLAKVWDKITYTKDVLWGIMHGFLVDPKGKQVPIQGLDLSDVKTNAGDYQDGDLADALDAAGAYSATAKAYDQHGRRDDGTLRPGILFAPTVASARHFAEAFNLAGIPTEVVVGDTPTAERDAIYARYAAGKTMVLSSCMVLTEGFDAPFAEVCVMARPTQVQRLYIQCVGRVLRPFAGKTGALVLDVVGVTDMHALASLNVLIPPVNGKPVELKPDETITDGVIRTQDAVKYLKGELGKASDVDLFDRSQTAWLRTPGGTWFIPTKHGYFFLHLSDKDHTWHVGKSATQYAMRNRYGAPHSPGAPIDINTYGWIIGGLTLDYAMTAAETYADDLDGSVSSRKASWRSKKYPSQAQLDQMEKHGIPHDPTIRKSAASDLISLYFASKLFDRTKGHAA